ncbi:Pre-mRNA-processing ATP-dependent RNA helicase prp11 [Wickerhamomyces ciferrii]|uniref:RNA helicase n=1 Tax=Wickerhamomyces ciferrii (strain ATCC 14091 / BCRC 22168 / CBS 111 / JCM 3599 / NBRC 0793 / NRRL Y-1031 F-60-10) TaxID=1206466 RepID=K0K6K4_WICCF|nr:Pre-mRNA-processing ATP-dependent RNA helicase prp11 [Wickerhamomyces ciferrii]CCH40560.1 Pre-mRNA-processing ATP-dependent RNA helicase prp11 [Wickerhamomyces ciferrii]
MNRYNNSRPGGYGARGRGGYSRGYENQSRYQDRDRDRAWNRDRDRYERNIGRENVPVRQDVQVQHEVKTTTDSEKQSQNGEAPKEDQANSDDVKKQERLKKLQAWKKKQEERKKQQESATKTAPSAAISPSPSTTEIPKKPLLKTKSLTSAKPKMKFGLGKTTKKNNLFADSDEENDTPQKRSVFIPKATNDDHDDDNDTHMVDADDGHYQDQANKADEDEDDPLDAFMRKIEGVEEDDDDKPKTKQGENGGPTLDDEDNNDEVGQYEFNDDDEAGELLRKLKTKKSKNLHIPKYNLKEMEKFPKNFLVQLESIDPDEVINFRVMNNIFINNKSISPVMNFYHFGLDAQTLNVINNELSFDNPTAIQSQTIPAIMSGKDVIGIGRTGSGKTMCFLLSMLKHIKQQRPLANGETGPLGLILSPTRELALQIFDACQVFLKNTNLKAICCTGGSELNKQINEIKKGIEIVVATPGRFIDLLTLNNGKLLKTDRITFVTLDEADRLFDLGFEPQINQTMKTIRPDKQCVLFSATFPSKLQQFAVKILKKPIIITVGNKQVVNETITQQAKLFDDENDKFNHLLNLLGKQGDQKTIIFCDSQIQVNFMNRRLVEKGYSPVPIHAGLPSHERTANLSNFRKQSNILICTEVLSRGLDVPDVNLVILYNAARTFAQYVHTTGRTARGNTKGTAISLLSKGEDTQAYILYKCMVEDEIPTDIKDLAISFEKELKEGKKKISSGFGGKGLDHLDKLRDETEKSERKKYGEDETKKNVKENGSDDNEFNGNDNTNEDDEIDSSSDLNLDIIYNSKIDGSAPDSGLYNARININDLPQSVRWHATNNASLSKITEETSTSITYKGRYYPEGQQPKENEEAKLYLLVEGSKDYEVAEAVEQLKQLFMGGLKSKSNEQNGKFSL